MKKRDRPPPPEDRHETFAARWSRLKRQDTRKTPQKAAGNTGDSKPPPQETAVEAALRKAALRALFRRPELSPLDGLNEYDGDYTYFTPRGEVITREMQRALTRLADAAATDAPAEQQMETPVESASTPPPNPPSKP